jgi:hypothetical protein
MNFNIETIDGNETFSGCYRFTPAERVLTLIGWKVLLARH